MTQPMTADEIKRDNQERVMRRIAPGMYEYRGHFIRCVRRGAVSAAAWRYGPLPNRTGIEGDCFARLNCARRIDEHYYQRMGANNCRTQQTPEQRQFVLDLINLQNRADAIGLHATARKLDAAVQQVGWELAGEPEKAISYRRVGRPRRR